MVDSVNLIHCTPDAEKLLVYIARVSNPESASKGEREENLIRYLIKHGHWSPFEMVSACVEINTSREIGRQLLRHRSFSFQEFSQRYASPDAATYIREPRKQDLKNRQNSIPDVLNEKIVREWKDRQRMSHDQAMEDYIWALDNDIAKECARAVLPEGITPTRLYMHGSLRSWIHYLKARLDPSTQREHRAVAEEISLLLSKSFPLTWKALELG